MTNGSATILIVDDNKRNAVNMQRLLMAEGYNVFVCNDGPSALIFIEEQPVDLVLLDVVMPDMDGYEVLRRIRQQFGDQIAVLLASGEHTAGWDAAHGLSIGADDYMIRPIETTELNARIVAKLRQRSLERQLRGQQKEAEAQSSLLHRVVRTLQHVAGRHVTENFGEMVVEAFHNELKDASARYWQPYNESLRPVPFFEFEPPTQVVEGLALGDNFIRLENRVYLPLRLQSKVVGVIELAWQRDWPQGVRTILATLADSLVILYQAHLYFQLIERESTFNALLNRLAGQETGLDEIFAELHQHLNAKLLLFSRYFSRLAGEALPEFTEPTGEMAIPLTAHYQKHRIIEELVQKRHPITVKAEGAVPTHQVFPVFAAGELIAVLLAVPPDENLEVLHNHTTDFERTARFLASVLQRQREQDIREQNRRESFLRDFLYGTLANDLTRPTLFLRATALGLNLAHSGVVARIIIPDFDKIVDWSDPAFEGRTEELLTPILRLARRTRDSLQLEGLEVILGDSVVTVVSLPGATSEEQAKRKLLQWAERLRDSAQQAIVAQNRPVIGIGRFAKEWQDLPRSANEADRAAQLAATNRHTPYTYYGDLGSERLLAAIGDRQELQRFHHEQLGALIEYDTDRTGDLVHTLEMFFANGAHLKHTAEELNIHANTLKYRLDQIAQRTGRDPREPNTALDYQLALKIHRML
jgi:DNA-binding response OmpR family regulator/sugar diacid utilization regulator